MESDSIVQRKVNRSVAQPLLLCLNREYIEISDDKSDCALVCVQFHLPLADRANAIEIVLSAR